MGRTRKERKARQQFFVTDVVVFVVEVVQSTGDGLRDENGKDEVQVWTGTKMSVPLLAIPVNRRNNRRVGSGHKHNR
jgi:hypothetical protein